MFEKTDIFNFIYCRMYTCKHHVTPLVCIILCLYAPVKINLIEKCKLLFKVIFIITIQHFSKRLDKTELVINGIIKMVKYRSVMQERGK
jgi:hypothetical protein